MPTETIRPTSHAPQVAGGGAVVNPGYAHDGTTATAAFLNAPSEGDEAIEKLYGFPADTSPSGRDQVLLKTSAQWGPTDVSYDKGVVYFRKVSTDPWTQVLIYTGGSGWSTAGQSTESVDITALAGSQPSTDWQVLVQFFNGGSGIGGPPVPAGI